MFCVLLMCLQHSCKYPTIVQNYFIQAKETIEHTAFCHPKPKLHYSHKNDSDHLRPSLPRMDRNKLKRIKIKQKSSLLKRYICISFKCLKSHEHLFSLSPLLCYYFFFSQGKRTASLA